MSEVYLARTNQKLNFARLHLDALKNAQNSSAWSKHALIESYQESVLFHLASTYSALLREVAERYSVETESIVGLPDLVLGFEKAGYESPELSELQQLEARQDSWLHKLLKAYAACWVAVDKQTATISSSLSEIHVMQVNPDHAEDQDVYTEYQAWLSNMRQLVDRLREGMQEW